MRAAKLTDCDELENLEMQLFPENCMNAFTLRQELAVSSGTVVDVDGHIAGYLLRRNTGGIIDILRVGVLPAYRRKGIARQLLTAALGPRTILLVRKDNDAAIKLYLELGFAITGHGANSWLMSRSQSN